MDMQAKHQDQLVFHLTGRIQGSALTPIAEAALRPALLAPYRDLDALRYDFPLVLDEHGEGADFAHSLATLVDRMLGEVAPRGFEGERLRRHALQLEQEIRRAVSAGADDTLQILWDTAAANLGAREGETLEQVLQHAGSALRCDGPVLGCTPDMPARLLTQAWRAAQRAKARAFHARVSRLVLKLSDILRAAQSHSQAGRTPQSLMASVGAPHQAQFDFEALSRVIGKGVPRDELPAARHARLAQTLKVLESQRFFAPPGSEDTDAAYHTFVFDDCASAAAAYRARLDELAAVVKAIGIAELEVEGAYVEAEHDLIFAAQDASALTADDLARFPDYLVCIPAERNDAPENANLMELLSSGMPLKVLVLTTALLDESAIGTGHFAFGVRSARLATTAMGLGGMFVLQAPSSDLFALRARIARGLACAGPALFCVFAGSTESRDALPPYLSAAAAMQSRAFPAFSYDAAAGSNWATRFSLENNPQPERDWSSETLSYADAAQQRVQQACAFTFADFVFCDPHYAAHFALVAPEAWHDDMLPVAEWLTLTEDEALQRVPYLLAVDAHDTLQRVIVDARLMQATRRCLLLWRRLQEHAGVHDAHMGNGVAPDQPVSPPATAAPDEAAPAAKDEAPSEQPPASAEHSRDEAWIETARCPSCNECQNINPRMFAYDANKQAYIKDIAAGTYRQLVEAAESCQVAIIHPGAPRDPNEPDLDALLARAEAFR